MPGAAKESFRTLRKRLVHSQYDRSITKVIEKTKWSDAVFLKLSGLKNSLHS